MEQDILQIVMRYIHIVAAIFVVGGLGFYAICLTPAMRLLDDGFSESWSKMIQKRFVRLLWVGIAGLLVSGVYNWMKSVQTYKAMGASGNALIGTKVLLALLIFAIVWAGSIGLLKPKTWQKSALHLAAIVILLATILRYFRLEHLQSLVGGG